MEGRKVLRWGRPRGTKLSEESKKKISLGVIKVYEEYLKQKKLDEEKENSNKVEEI